MPRIQIDLDEKEDEIVEAFKFKSCKGLNKKESLKKLIREFGKLPEIKEALMIQNGKKKTKKGS